MVEAPAANACQTAAVALQELAKLLYGKSSVSHNPAHRMSVDRIVPRNGHDPDTVGHEDVFPLPEDPETSLLQCPHSILMIDAGDLRHD